MQNMFELVSLELKLCKFEFFLDFSILYVDFQQITSEPPGKQAIVYLLFFVLSSCLFCFPFFLFFLSLLYCVAHFLAGSFCVDMMRHEVTDVLKSMR